MLTSSYSVSLDSLSDNAVLIGLTWGLIENSNDYGVELMFLDPTHPKALPSTGTVVVIESIVNIDTDPDFAKQVVTDYKSVLCKRFKHSALIPLKLL